MGGAANGKGNAGATAEANILNDPEAARIVFEAGWPLTMVGLDVTRQTVMLPEFVEKLRALDNPFTNFIYKMLPFYQNFYNEVEGITGFPCMILRLWLTPSNRNSLQPKSCAC